LHQQRRRGVTSLSMPPHADRAKDFCPRPGPFFIFRRRPGSYKRNARIRPRRCPPSAVAGSVAEVERLLKIGTCDVSDVQHVNLGASHEEDKSIGFDDELSELDARKELVLTGKWTSLRHRDERCDCLFELPVPLQCRFGLTMLDHVRDSVECFVAGLLPEDDVVLHVGIIA